jgi:large subunit ribosomal protein L25
MARIAFDAQTRTDFGKGAARQLRRAGRIPAVVYGAGTTSHVSLDAHDLVQALKKKGVVLDITIDGTSVATVARDIQKDPVRNEIEHVDLLVITEQQAQARAEANA